ncbi:aldose epimerase family protein [Stakelama flava]|nr:aldose epimerase family protein [Stakelama flava]
MEATREQFGILEDGTAIEMVTLKNRAGITAKVITLGAALQSLLLPDRDGLFADVVLGHDTPLEYMSGSCFFGGSIGRYANRIAGGTFMLDGKRYQLPVNDDPNCLHGGNGFDKRVWAIKSMSDGPPASVVLHYRSVDGDQGFPGNLDITATYSLDDQGRLAIEYEAATDAPTIVSLTNHSYFNLAGADADRSALESLLTLDADYFTPVDETLIPTGEIRRVEDTPFDFRAGVRPAARVRDAGCEQLRIARGYDQNMVLSGEAGTLRRAARLEDPQSGRVVELSTTAPGMQFYSGNFLDGTIVGKGGTLYRQGDGIAFEPQLFPDSPNQPDFPSARLDPGSIYRNRIVYDFFTADAVPSVQ